MKKLLVKVASLICVFALALPSAAAFAATSNIQSNDKAAVDLTYTANGYVNVKYTGTSTAKLKVIIKTPTNIDYQYNLSKNANGEVFPLSEGDGKYSVTVYTNTTGSSYAKTFLTSFDVKLSDSFAPFLTSSQYVNYTDKSETVKKATELTKDVKKDLDKIIKIYDYVVTFTYDKEKAKTVQSGYLPDVDKILSSKKGICFDYAAVMTAMLRSQKIPCKLIVGYAGTAYHAWINVYTKETGWIEGFIQFDGKNWSRMDPTFDSSANGSATVQKFIGDGKNYTVKYQY